MITVHNSHQNIFANLVKIMTSSISLLAIITTCEQTVRQIVEFLLRRRYILRQCDPSLELTS